MGWEKLSLEDYLTENLFMSSWEYVFGGVM